MSTDAIMSTSRDSAEERDGEEMMSIDPKPSNVSMTSVTKLTVDTASEAAESRDDSGAVPEREATGQKDERQGTAPVPPPVAATSTCCFIIHKEEGTAKEENPEGTSSSTYSRQLPESTWPGAGIILTEAPLIHTVMEVQQDRRRMIYMVILSTACLRCKDTARMEARSVTRVSVPVRTLIHRHTCSLIKELLCINSVSSTASSYVGLYV